MRPLILLAACVLATIAVPSARAAVSCDVSATAMDFGPVAAEVGTRAIATATLTAACRRLDVGLAVLVPLRLWAATPRVLIGPSGAQLTAGLYSDAMRTQAFPSSTVNAVSTSVLATTAGGTTAVPVYGELVITAPVPSGSYTLSLLVTLEY